MVLNAAVLMLREAEELKETISKFKSGTSMLQERSLWTTQQQLQKICQKLLVLDLDYALDKKVEQDLWNIGFKQQIEALQATSKDRKNPLRSEGQAMLSWVLQAAAGFYLCLLHQICTTFQLDLPFRRRASLLGWVEGWGAGEGGCASRLPAAAAARYICQHCLVHLGDLARYRQQMRVAHTFYRHALVVSVHSGQPYNQLALVWWRRGRRLAAVYWHVRSLLVRAPFPPAPANLARTLRAAADQRSEIRDLPVLPGVTSSLPTTPTVTSKRLDAHSYVTELLRALHFIHSGDELETASSLVELLNSSLITLIATDSFDSMTLIKMVCVLIWAVLSSTEDLSIQPRAVTEGEALSAALSCSLASGALLALLLPSYMTDAPLDNTLPAVKVFLQWSWSSVRVVRAVWGRPALWPALAHLLNKLAAIEQQDTYATVPLPEDEELYGFLPLESALQHLRFPNHAAWDTYAGVPASDAALESPQEVATCVLEEPELQKRVRAHRLVRLGKALADSHPDLFSYTVEDEVVNFTAASVCGEPPQLADVLAELAEARREGVTAEADTGSDTEEEPAPRPPRVISEADFREKVREKRAGILKPQGSLERAREERALLTQDEHPHSSDECSDEGVGEEKREARKPRVNIAMAAIMRKQEETNKQVKFVSPPPTHESTADSTEAKEDKPKVIQPKAMKSLANIPIGRKTGGILSLKDKSGYPHLVNTDPEPKKEKEEKKEAKPQPGQTYQQKKEAPPARSADHPQTFAEGPRITFQKNYGIQNAGIIYNPEYRPAVNNQGIRLPVVNPKEIDVRTAALQKQSSRQDPFHEGKFAGYQMSGDKKNFLNDLPPRFANQYRYWQAAQENQFNDNKFRDDGFKGNAGGAYDQPRGGWPNRPEYAAPQPPWWNQGYGAKPPYFGPNNNQYSYDSFGRKEGQYPSVGRPVQTLQNLLTSPDFSSSLGSYAYPPPVQYDAAMYPQFNNLGYRMPMKPPYPPEDARAPPAAGFGGLDNQNRTLNFNDQPDGTLEQQKMGEGVAEAPSNMYSLFSGAPNAGWTAHSLPTQSLWSGPGPSPLERLLEQQKQSRAPQ